MTDMRNVTGRTRIVAVVIMGMCFMAGFLHSAGKGLPYYSPRNLSFSPDGKSIACSDETAGQLVFVDAATKKVTKKAGLNGKPAGVVWAPDGGSVYVAECDAGTVAQVDAANGKVLRRLPVGRMPVGLAIAPKKKLLLACNSGLNTVSLVALDNGKEKACLPVPRSPFAVAVTPDESLAVVTNFLPADPSTGTEVSCKVTLIDLNQCKVVNNIRLPNGSILTREVAISPDGRWAYTVHAVGRFTVPTTQLERGWVNTNALSIIDLKKQTHYATMLLDQVSQGAAEPWGVALTPDGNTLWITLSGVHKLAKVAMSDVQKLLAGDLKGHENLAEMGSGYSGSRSVWYKISQDPAERENLVNDLSALYIAGVIQKPKVKGKNPMGISISPDGKQLAVAAYYSGAIVMVDSANPNAQDYVPLGKATKKFDLVRKGEMIFHDATYCFQHWMSCATCHPNHARVDGLNWDLLNDGIGNPKNTRSLLLSHKTPPAMSLGVRSDMGVASLAGFRHILFREPQEGEVEAVKAYLKSLKPRPSPYLLPNGAMTESAKKGKVIFDNEKVGCAKCHSGDYLTNGKIVDVATKGEYDRADAFDTPTLIGLWETAPYLHDGAAVTLEEVLIKFNKKDKHGVTSHLSKEEIADLVAYLLSL